MAKPVRPLGLAPAITIWTLCALLLAASVAQMIITAAAALQANGATGLQWSSLGFCVGGFGIPGYSCAHGPSVLARRGAAGRLGMLGMNLASVAVTALSAAFTAVVMLRHRQGKWRYGREWSKWVVCLLQVLVVLTTAPHLLRLQFNVHTCATGLVTQAWCHPGPASHPPLAHALQVGIPFLIAARITLLLAVFTVTVFVFGNPADPTNPVQGSLLYYRNFSAGGGGAAAKETRPLMYQDSGLQQQLNLARRHGGRGGR